MRFNNKITFIIEDIDSTEGNNIKINFKSKIPIHRKDINEWTPAEGLAVGLLDILATHNLGKEFMQVRGALN